MSTYGIIEERYLPVVDPSPGDMVRVVQGGKSAMAVASSLPPSSEISDKITTIENEQEVINGKISDVEESQSNLNNRVVVAEGNISTNSDDIASLQASQGSGLPGYATKADLPASATANSLALVTNDPTPANNGTYRWTGSAWIISADRTTILEQKVAQSQVLTDRVVTTAGGVNMFNTAGATAGVSISAADGNTFVKANWSATDFIPVSPSMPYRRTTADAYAQYDSNKVFIGGAATASTFATARTAAYVRLGYANSTAATEVLALASQWPATYVPFVKSPGITKVKIPNESVESIIFPVGNTLRDDLKVGPRNASFLRHASRNLFDKTRVTPGIRLTLTNIPAYDTTNNISEYIPVEGSTQYAFTEGSFTHEYDASLNLINSHASGILNFTTQANTRFIRTTVRNVTLANMMMVKGSVVPSTYIGFDQYTLAPEILGASSGRFGGVNWNAMGDSITADAGGTYVDEVSTSIGASLARNYGIGGTAISVRAAPWDTNAMCIRYVDMDVNASLITVLGGTNDFGTSVLLGDMSSTATNTFYGALHTLCQGLISRFPTASIFFFTPLPRATMNTLNGRGLRLEAYVNAIKEVCSYYAIPVVDLYSITQFRPWNSANDTAYMGDGLHPNTAGYAMLSPIIASQLKTL